jgi:hypothetical protein
MYAGSGDLPHISSVGAASSSGQNELKLHDPKQFPPLAFACLKRTQKNPKTYDKNEDQEIHGVTKRVYEKFLKDEGDEEITKAIQGGCEAFIQEIANIKDTHTDDTVWPDTDSEGYACAEQVRFNCLPKPLSIYIQLTSGSQSEYPIQAPYSPPRTTEAPRSLRYTHPLERYFGVKQYYSYQLYESLNELYEQYEKEGNNDLQINITPSELVNYLVDTFRMESIIKDEILGKIEHLTCPNQAIYNILKIANSWLASNRQYYLIDNTVYNYAILPHGSSIIYYPMRLNQALDLLFEVYKFEVYQPRHRNTQALEKLIANSKIIIRINQQYSKQGTLKIGDSPEHLKGILFQKLNIVSEKGCKKFDRIMRKSNSRSRTDKIFETVRKWITDLQPLLPIESPLHNSQPSPTLIKCAATTANLNLNSHTEEGGSNSISHYTSPHTTSVVHESESTASVTVVIPFHLRHIENGQDTDQLMYYPKEFGQSLHQLIVDYETGGPNKINNILETINAFIIRRHTTSNTDSQECRMEDTLPQCLKYYLWNHFTLNQDYRTLFDDTIVYWTQRRWTRHQEVAFSRTHEVYMRFKLAEALHKYQTTQQKTPTYDDMYQEIINTLTQKRC